MRPATSTWLFDKFISSNTLQNNDTGKGQQKIKFQIISPSQNFQNFLFFFQLDEQGLEASLRLEQAIIIADCQVLAAVINFLHQDWGSYMKGGWVLRKAWKIYQKAYSQIRAIYMQKVGLAGNTLGRVLSMKYNDFFTERRLFCRWGPRPRHNCV